MPRHYLRSLAEHAVEHTGEQLLAGAADDAVSEPWHSAHGDLLAPEDSAARTVRGDLELSPACDAPPCLDQLAVRGLVPLHDLHRVVKPDGPHPGAGEETVVGANDGGQRHEVSVALPSSQPSPCLGRLKGHHAHDLELGHGMIVGMTMSFASPDDVKQRLAKAGYLASDAVATTVFLAATLQKPLLIEGPAGVGK